MKKWIMPLCLVALFSSSVFAGQMTLRLTTNHTEDFVTSQAVRVFADRVKERTNGEIVVECYYNAVLGEEKAAAEQTQFGAIDLLRISISPMSEFVPEFNGLQLPFLYANAEHYWKALDDPEIGLKLLRDQKAKDAGFYGLCYYDGGARSFFFRNKMVRTPADMANLTIRVQESSLMIGLIRILGANPTAMPSSDVYGALQTGVIDGAENNLPFYLSQSYPEVAPMITLNEHTRVPDSLFMSMMTVNKLTPEQVKIIEEAAMESSHWQRKAWAEEEIKARQRCLELGCTITELTLDEKRQFMDMVKPLNAREGAANISIIEAIGKLM
ncbi:MAG: TRAP transporter substrate-binding protein [Planctomycetes bacterium]|nr:TRAP transporter substrate-binding protein [Planctomycetota bacterium]